MTAAIETLEVRPQAGAQNPLADARRLTDSLFDLIRPEALYERPIAERHRLIFYLGHLEAFDWNLLRPHVPRLNSFLPAFDQLFAFGIDPVDGGLPSDSGCDWPEAGEIRNYNDQVRAALDQHEHDPLLLQMAIEHRLMHAETLSYLMHRLPFHHKTPVAQIPVARVPFQADTREAIEIPAGRALLGNPGDGTFGWDNEFGAHVVNVAAFTIDRYKVTNRDYLAFVDAGGYSNRRYWEPESWKWLQSEAITHPPFWKRGEGDDEWRCIGMFLETDLPLDSPVWVSHAEAAAYACWCEGRLPTEAEWHRAAYGYGLARYPWGDAEPSRRHGYFDFERWDPAPVNAFPAGRSTFGLDGLLCNGWEWTSTVFAPFEGFMAHPSYPGYSANFFDGQHYVMKGGSPRTASAMLRRSFRNWFQPHYRRAYAGFRCVRGL